MPSAISVSPSQDWLGNDGTWSTFAIRVGNPPQTISILPATSQQAIWVVLVHDGCLNSPYVQRTCASTRGGVFHLNESISYAPLDNGDLFYLPFFPEEALGGNYTWKSAECFIGLDTVELGYPGSLNNILRDQMILTYVATTPYVGILGLSSQPTNYSSIGIEEPSTLSTMFTNNYIPSLYYGYNAGALYANTFASLTLGGYDAARGNQKDVLTVPLGPNNNRNLDVQINEITISTTSGNHTATITSPPVAFIDSLVPEIWLPLEICQSFEEVLGLQWNDEFGIYLVDEDLYKHILKLNPSVTFSLGVPSDYGSGSGSSNDIQITLPYGAWNLTIAYPIANIDNGSRLLYFPLKRAEYSTQIFLGRTFLQSAYLAVDFNRTEFYLSQATFSDQTDIRTVYPGSGSSSLSGGAIAGIVVGVVAFALIVLGLLLWLWRRRKNERKWKQEEEAKQEEESKQEEVIPAGTIPEGMRENKSRGSLPGYTSDPDETRHQLDAVESARARVGSMQRYEMPSPPPPGTPWSYGSPGSPGSKNQEVAELSGDYLTARGFELPADRSPVAPVHTIESEPPIQERVANQEVESAPAPVVDQDTTHNLQEEPSSETKEEPSSETNEEPSSKTKEERAKQPSSET